MTLNDQIRDMLAAMPEFDAAEAEELLNQITEEDLERYTAVLDALNELFYEDHDRPIKIPTKTDAVREFMDKFSLYPEKMTGDFVKFRYERLVEELDEYKQAVESGDSVGQIDALVDLVYIAIGNAILSGYDFDQHFEAVAAANLSKVRGTKKGRENSGGVDVIKPEGWVGPEHRHELIFASTGLPDPITEERVKL